jgi:transcriptional regulator with XRE-family HTH domain
MSGDAPGPTPEGQLIRQVRDLSIPRLSIRAAAKRIGLSAEQWGYVERGYRPAGAGQPPRPFSPPAATLAKMAHALEITPERLESEGQRPDAAEILREILHREVETADTATAVLPSAPFADDARAASDRPYFDEINERRVALAARGITSPSGAQMFPDSPDDAKAWDGIGGRLDIGDRVWFIADLRRRAAARNPLASTG